MMKKIIKFITVFFIILSLPFLFINKSSVKAYSNNIYYEEVNLEKEKDNDSKKLSKTETVVVVISSILISAGIGFSIYWFILREKEEGEEKVWLISHLFTY